MWPVNRGHFRNCVSELGSLLAVCRSNDVETTPLLEAGGALNSLNSHPGITNGPEDDGSSRFFSAAAPFLCCADEFQPPLSLEPSHHTANPCGWDPPLVHLSSTVSSPVSASPSLVLTHGLSRKSSIEEKDDESPWLPTMGVSSSLGADDKGSSSYEVSLWTCIASRGILCWLWHVGFIQ